MLRNGKYLYFCKMFYGIKLRKAPDTNPHQKVTLKL